MIKEGFDSKVASCVIYLRAVLLIDRMMESVKGGIAVGIR